MLPTKIKLHKADGHLEIHYADGSRFELSAEYLRVMSPSAEVKGHGPGQEVLQYGKRHVKLLNIERAGNYALRLVFDDGHDSGIYTWDYLHKLGSEYDSLWQDYLNQLAKAGKHRETDVQVVKLIDPGKR